VEEDVVENFGGEPRGGKGGRKGSWWHSAVMRGKEGRRTSWKSDGTAAGRVEETNALLRLESEAMFENERVARSVWACDGKAKRSEEYGEE
jgi:hypothetical protein